MSIGRNHHHVSMTTPLFCPSFSSRNRCLDYEEMTGQLTCPGNIFEVVHSSLPMETHTFFASSNKPKM